MPTRNFIGSSAAVNALAYSQVAGSNERLRIGVIGCGGQATDHMHTLGKIRDPENRDVLAVSDVFDNRAEQAAQLTGGKVVKDYRRILDNRDIDYVLIATPEHWHYQMIVDTIAAGKHLYCEKPMTTTAAQSKRGVEK